MLLRHYGAPVADAPLEAAGVVVEVLVVVEVVEVVVVVGVVGGVGVATGAGMPVP
jgi:hypothetical protein